PSPGQVLGRHGIGAAARQGDRAAGVSGDPQSDQFVITAPADLDVALLYKTRSPSGAIDLVVYDMHYGDAEAAVSWVGQIG
ncbi:hypothetical protein V2A12_32850, partial [Pseudomonas aeruginosa]